MSASCEKNALQKDNFCGAVRTLVYNIFYSHVSTDNLILSIENDVAKRIINWHVYFYIPKGIKDKVNEKNIYKLVKVKKWRICKNHKTYNRRFGSRC